MDNPLPDPASTLHGKTLLIVDAGSIKKKFALLRLKKLGAKLIVLNKEKNWITSVADYIILADLENHKEAIDAVAKFLKENREVKLDGALTFWEDGVLLLSKIIDKFDLIGIPYKVAKKVRNKAMFREFCEKNGVNAPKHQIVKTLDEVRKVGKNFHYPLVLKPSFGSSSAFVLKVENFEELLHAFNYVKNNISASVESALTEGKDILIEEYIEGDEVDIDILVQNGKIKFYSISDNSRTAEPFFLESLRTTPSTLPEKQQDALLEMAEESLEKLGIQNGCIHFEAKVGKRGAFPIEINMRMGGDEIYPSIKGVWGVDLVEDSAKIATGIFIKKYNEDRPAKRCFLAQSFVADYSGILIKLDVDERLENKKYFEELHWFKKVGDPVLVPPEGYDFLGWMAVSGESILSAQDNLRDALKFIHYEIAKFDPASSMGKTKRKSHFTFASANKNILLGAAKIEHLRRTSIKNQRNLHIGVACNIYDDNNSGDTVETELMSVGRNVEKTLTERGYKVTFFDFNNLFKAIEDLRASNVDLVFNLCERINNSSLLEPHGAAILDALQIPYTGSNPFTLGLCLDKIRVKKTSRLSQYSNSTMGLCL